MEMFPSKETRNEIEYLLIQTIGDRNCMRKKQSNIIEKYPRLLDFEGEMVKILKNKILNIYFIKNYFLHYLLDYS